MNFLDMLAEQNIRDATARGAFANLPGAGKALDFDDELLTPVETRAIHRVLKNSGFLPPEIEQMREKMREAERLREQLARLAAKPITKPTAKPAENLTENNRGQTVTPSPLGSRLSSRLYALELTLAAKRSPGLKTAAAYVYRQKILNRLSGANRPSDEA